MTRGDGLGHDVFLILWVIVPEWGSSSSKVITRIDGWQVGTFSLRVRREIGKAAKPVAQGPPVLGKAMVDYNPAADAAPSAPSKSTKLAKTTPSKAAADGGLLFVTSPKVGLFRQGRTVKGKSGPPLCAEGQVVKKGQVVCYLEQLGTQQPVEADIDGKVEKVLFKDGEPVGYGDRLIAIRPWLLESLE
jgi:biotin carboxyl carrier protein